jgi:hypothetical protein
LASSSGPPIYGETTSITSQAVSSLATSASSSLSSVVITPQSSLSSSGFAISSQGSSNTLSSSTIVSSPSVPVSTALPDTSTTDLPSAAPSNSAYGSPSSGSVGQTSVDQPFSSSAGPESYPDGQVTVTLSPTYSSISTFVSQESPIPTCGAGTAAATVSSSGDSSVCQDPYGNTYNVTYGSKQYVGKVTKRAVTSNVNECLLLCNLQTDCVAANYVGNDCTLLRYALSYQRIIFLLISSQRGHWYYYCDDWTTCDCRYPTTRCQHRLHSSSNFRVCIRHVDSATRLWQFKHDTRAEHVRQWKPWIFPGHVDSHDDQQSSWSFERCLWLVFTR